jgi:hypothetical protein
MKSAATASAIEETRLSFGLGPSRQQEFGTLKLRLLITLGITPHQILKDQTALAIAAADISIVEFQAADETQPYSSASEVASVVADLLDLTIPAAKDQSRARD